jgi:pilus assembly protein CpaF
MSFDLILPFMRPIESLLLDDEVSEIMGNPDSTWWVERHGRVCREQHIEFGAAPLRTGLEVIANHLGKRLDEDNPRLHAQLPDGSRIAVWIPPLVSPAPAMSIRKFTSRHYALDDLVDRGTLPRSIAETLTQEVQNGKTLLISGGTGSGKTTLLRVLAEAIPTNERVVVIEDTPELQICQPNIVPAASQSHTFKAPVSFDELLKDALRFRPDRIILGEVRGTEARTLLDSFNTGHAGSLATIHANSAAKALRRFANLVLRSHPQTLLADVEAEIGEAVDYVVHLERQRGRRVVREVICISDYNRTTQQFVTEIVYQADIDPFENTAQSVFPFFNASPLEVVDPYRWDLLNPLEEAR